MCIDHDVRRRGNVNGSRMVESRSRLSGRVDMLDAVCGDSSRCGEKGVIAGGDFFSNCLYVLDVKIVLDSDYVKVVDNDTGGLRSRGLNLVLLQFFGRCGPSCHPRLDTRK